MGHVVRSTPEFYSIVARAWIAALTLTQSDSRDRLSYVLGLLSSVATFFTKQELCTKETLKVFIHNHDPSVLATWFLRHGEFSFKLIGDLRMERIGYGMLGYGVLIVLPTFLRGIHDAAENLDINELPSRFLVELVNQGVIGFVVRAVHALATSRASQSAGGNLAHLVSACTYFLAKLLEDERFKQARTAISVALIRCIAVCGEQPDLAEMTGDLVTRLWILLPSYTIHWGDQSGVDVVRVLAEYEQTIPKFAPEVREAWTRFVVVAKHRAEFADSVDSSGIVNMKACDNTLCTRLGPKNEFKRCSGCEALYYCSIQCQAVDWHNGHRAACKTHDYQLSGRVPFATPRQRAFARAMLHRDYTHLKLKIFVQAVACMRVSRDPHAGYFVVFDYSQGGPALGVYSLVEPSDALDWLARAGIQWDLTVARAARSEGRMTIHAVRVREAKAPRHWVVPLHSDSGVIHEELVKMACAQDGENQTEDFKELVDRSNSEVLEFH
ncbi:hypothetical protein FB45DRAFT_928908 [Roridomyces roridus]|uniref:MYND-type domain-containing protein n=1 Tax=Roridomyces roridus TaxID=1738132 RepID=A0AAD7FI54_9AGAR|nr:hypothetical protein FB45DRAFT_928908 [Roridomyces roridus]